MLPHSSQRSEPATVKPNLIQALANLGGIDSIEDVLLPDPVPLAPKDTPFDASDELDGLTGLALKRAREILQEPIDFENDKVLKVQVATIGKILDTQVRVDEGRLKRRKLDALPKLLEIIASEERRLGRVTPLLPA